MKVCMIVANGFEEFEAMGSFTVLKRAGIDIDLYSIEGKEAVSSHGLTVCGLKPFSAFKDDNYAAIILPGGPHYQALEASNELKNIIKDFVSKNKKIAAICASPTILGRMGLLKGKKYTCYKSMDDDFGGTYKEDYAVTDGNLITGKGPAAALDFGLEVLAQLVGRQTVGEVKKGMLYK